jgi:hypothetical protein
LREADDGEVDIDLDLEREGDVVGGVEICNNNKNEDVCSGYMHKKKLTTSRSRHGHPPSSSLTSLLVLLALSLSISTALSLLPSCAL